VAEIFRTSPDRPWGPPRLLYSGYQVFPRGKEQPRSDADLLPTSNAVGHERVELYLYSLYGPYGLYRASVPVQGWPLTLPYSRAIPLLPSMGRTACIEPQCLYKGDLYLCLMYLSPCLSYPAYKSNIFCTVLEFHLWPCFSTLSQKRSDFHKQNGVWTQNV